MGKAIANFIARWKGKGDEKQDTSKFWIDLLQSVFGITNTSDAIYFEKRVKMEDSVRFIDAYIPSTLTIIEQKSYGIDLSKEQYQSGGESLTPYGQARRYNNNLPKHEQAKWIVCCNFDRFEIHDMDKPLDQPVVINLCDIEKDYSALSFLTNIKIQEIHRAEEVSFQAGRLIAKLYDLVLPQYDNPKDPYTLKSLNQLCVRLVFCLYAEDNGLFGEKNMFYNYLSNFKVSQFRDGLIDLFKVFDKPYEARGKYMNPELKKFPYIKGGIFTEKIEIPQFTEEIVNVILNEASLDIDWSDISPTVFGAVFESTLNPETRRKGGMHYTSVENIHKVIDPLFLDSLEEEFSLANSIPVKSKKEKALIAFQDKLSSLTFLDPACGSGNFLTETYLSLRRLENRVLESLGIEGLLGFEEFSPIKVTIDQFYGIEINDFAVAVARTALWIAESQTMKETEHIIGRSIEYFPLRENPNIVEANALRIDWNEVVSKENLNYIMGNPPFVGYSLQSEEQKQDILNVYKDKGGKVYKTAGKIDYVSGWYYKASAFIQNTKVCVAFVSTNSITQGDQVAPIWKPLYEQFSISIHFCWRPFIWDSEANQKAHVHCVIIGFSNDNQPSSKRIFCPDGSVVFAQNISPYLISSDNVFVESRNKPICGVPNMTTGNRPADGGHLIIEADEYEHFIREEPAAKAYIKRLIGAQEYINNKERYCLWLKGISPAELRKMPLVLERIERCKADRENAPDVGRRKLAQTPHLFRETSNPESYIVVPATSSENRAYIPLGFLDGNTIPTNAVIIIPGADVYCFGILTSYVHMAWMRTVCGRLKSDYRYSKDVVYNNFPWPNPTVIQKEKIAKTAQSILDARSLYPDCSLADLYDELTMPIELRKAHQANDRAVMEAYGFDQSMSEEQIVAELLKMYQRLTKQ